MEPQQPVRAMDSYGTEDMTIPEIKLVQNVGGTEAKEAGAVPGDFFSIVTGEVTKGDVGLDIVVVDIRKTRTYWGRTEIEDEPPICGSSDGKTNQDQESCEQCPHDARCDTPWLLPAAERRTKCLLNYTVLAINAKDGLPTLLRATGISTQAVRSLMTALRLNKTLKGEYHRALVHVTSVIKKSESGEAYAMSLRATKLVDDEAQVEEFRVQSLSLLGMADAALLPEGEAEADPDAAALPGEKKQLPAGWDGEADEKETPPPPPPPPGEEAKETGEKKAGEKKPAPTPTPATKPNPIDVDF